MKGIDIRLARIKRGLRQEDVAQRAGMSQETLSRIERDKLIPSRETLQRIMQAIQKGNSTE